MTEQPSEVSEERIVINCRGTWPEALELVLLWNTALWTGLADRK